MPSPEHDSHNAAEPDQTPRICLERGGNSIHRDLNVDPTLAELYGGAQCSSQGTILDDMDLSKLEVSLLLEVELIDVPRAIRQLSPYDPSDNESLLPVVWVILHDDHTTSLTLGNELLSVLISGLLAVIKQTPTHGPCQRPTQSCLLG